MTSNAERVLGLARSRQPTLGEGRLLCVDGPAGSGKTTLAAEVASLAGGAAVIHMDDLFEGWRGLAQVDDQLGTLLRPLAEGFPGSYRRWDWPG
ncbi:MAG TPA: 4-amino-4-deoxy-L-arabinose transferase, partial [Nocardioides sp.]|nr:4-amino-4-deoxy-L-arabinose transferase [Nocardioides sp.]